MPEESDLLTEIQDIGGRELMFFAWRGSGHVKVLQDQSLGPQWVANVHRLGHRRKGWAPLLRCNPRHRDWLGHTNHDPTGRTEREAILAIGEALWERANPPATNDNQEAT